MLHLLHWFAAILAVLQGCSARQTPEPKSEHWALLIAGSNGWWNYRHQSDVLHAYHVLKAKGVKPENMIVMVYDDIANAKYNPFPGKIYNKPNGDDVYTGVPLDYTGRHVNVDVFLSVLSGNVSAVQNKGSGKVINSGPGDRVFVYYSDHGASGLICMPEGDDLYADDLHKVLKSRFRDGKHGELVFYLEACESGSMFEGLTRGIDMFATTAADPSESSWAYYCPGDTADPASKSTEPTPDTIGACLGDEYSIHWIEDAEAADLTIETLKEQYVRVKHLTQESHVQHYGRGRIQIEEASNFIGITNLVPPTQDVPENVEDEDDEVEDEDQSMVAALLKGESKTVSAHRKLLEDEEDEVEFVKNVEASEHDSEDEDEAEHEPKLQGEDDDVEEDELSRAVDNKLRVPQRDAELIGMYAALRRNDLTAEMRKEVEDEVYRTIETRRKVEEHATQSAERLLVTSNGRLMSWLSGHMIESEMSNSASNSALPNGNMVLVQHSGSSSLHSRLQPFTTQLLFGVNGRPSSEGQPLVDNWDCLREMVKVWKTSTNIWNNAAKRHTRYFANLCNAGVRPQDFAHALRQPQQQSQSSSAQVQL